MLSPDGKYLFFTSGREGQDDIFWVDAGVIAALRPPTAETQPDPSRRSSNWAVQPRTPRKPG